MQVIWNIPFPRTIVWTFWLPIWLSHKPIKTALSHYYSNTFLLMFDTNTKNIPYVTVYSLHCHHQTLLLLILICLNQYLVSLSYCHYTLVFLLKNVSVCILRYLQFTLTCGTCEFVNRLKCATFLTKFFMVFYLFKFYINTSILHYLD